VRDVIETRSSRAPLCPPVLGQENVELLLPKTFVFHDVGVVVPFSTPAFGMT
jgi:hypothetical protein